MWADVVLLLDFNWILTTNQILMIFKMSCWKFTRLKSLQYSCSLFWAWREWYNGSHIYRTQYITSRDPEKLFHYYVKPYCILVNWINFNHLSRQCLRVTSAVKSFCRRPTWRRTSSSVIWRMRWPALSAHCLGSRTTSWTSTSTPHT